MPESSFPQDFPPHLNSSAPIESILGSAALGNHPLPFETMHSRQFEQFCWWLLRREYEIHGCQLIGRSGAAQGGIDLFGYSRNNKDQLFVFECKCWKDYTPSALLDAVDHFLANKWAIPNTQFTLVIAQEGIGKLANAWHVARQKLNARNIMGELWTGLDLTDRIRSHPDILVRFFPEVTANFYCNEWMRRVDFMQQLQKALVDENPVIRNIAKNFIDHERTDKNDLELERISESDRSWNITNPWMHIHAILPNEQFISGSAGIVIKTPTTSGFTVAVGQEWILRNLLSHVGAPANHAFRPFIIHRPTPSDTESEITIDINSARLQISNDGLRAMCEVLDKLTPVYINAMRFLEKRWGAEGFPIVGHGSDTAVALCKIPLRLWNQMLTFAFEHDEATGDSDWHIFEKNYHYIKIYTKRPHPSFEPGYHAFIRARTVAGLSYKDDVLLTWEPPDTFENFQVSATKWMPCSETMTWLRDKFIPAVGRRLIEDEIRSMWPWQRQKKRRELATLWASLHVRLLECRQASLLENDHYKAIGLVATVTALQEGMVNTYPRLYLPAEETYSLYRAIQIIMRGKRGYVPYIASKLGLEGNCSSHHDVISEIEQRIQGDLSSPSAAAIRSFLSAMLEGLDDDDKWLTGAERDEIFSALRPLIYHRDIEQLFHRHSQRNFD